MGTSDKKSDQRQEIGLSSTLRDIPSLGKYTDEIKDDMMNNTAK